MTRIIIPNVQKMTDEQSLKLMKIFDENRIFYIITKDDNRSFFEKLMGIRR